MWRGKKISVVFSTFNEKSSIRKCIADFFKTGIVDEVIAVNNNAASGTDNEIKKTKARLFYEKRQGFGYGYQKALSMASGEIMIMTEPDATFVADDIFKLLAYCNDFDVVFGTRTTSILIGEGANMGSLLKWGNFVVAKFVEILFNTTQLTDVGCTYRLIKKQAYEKIKSKFAVGGNEFNLDMMLQVIRNNIKFIEIPLNYKRRIGKSSVTGSFSKTLKVAFKMLILTLRHRFNIIKS